MGSKYFMKTAAVVLTGSLCAAALSACGTKETKAEITPSDVVATVNGEEIPAGVLAMLARYQQIQTGYFYQMYYGMDAGSIWDMQVDEETGETYGQQAVNSMLEELEKMYLLRAHAEEYGVALTEEQKTAIKDAADAFVEANGEEVLTKMMTDQASVEEYLELTAYEQLMHDPMVADTDREVSDEEAQQTTVTYVTITKPEEETEDIENEEIEAEDTESEETEDAESEEVEETEGEAPEAAESEEAENGEGEAAEVKTPEELQELAQQILDALSEEPEQDMTAAAQEIYAEASVQTASYSANDEEDLSVPAEVREAAAGLKDGELTEEIIETETAFYIVRLDAEFDEGATEEERLNIISNRENEHYTEIVDGWVEEAEIEVKEEVKAGITITGTELFTAKQPEEAEADGAEVTVGEEAEAVELEEEASDEEAEAADLEEELSEEELETKETEEE